MAIGLVKGNTIVGIKGEATSASATIEIINNSFDSGDKVTVNGLDFEEGVDWAAGGSIALSTDALADAINASTNKLISGVLSALSDGVDTVTLTADVPGTDGNAITLGETDNATDNFTLSGALFSGGSFTEGVAAAPASSADYVQVLEDGLELSPAKELVERTILTSSIGKVTPRASVKSASGSIPLEWRAAGVEGQAPQYEPLLFSGMGDRRRLANRITTGSSHTTSKIILASADTKVSVGDFVVILEAGDHSAHFVTAVASGDFDYLPSRSTPPSDSVELAKTVTYLSKNTGQLPLTASIFWGDEIRERAIGARVASMSLENFTTGQIPNLNFGHEALSFDEADASAPQIPAYDSGLPPLALNAIVAQDDVCVELNEFSLSLESTIGFLTSVKSSDGRLASRVVERVLSGSFSPYKDDADISNFTKFNANTAFSLIVTAQNASSVSGEFELGSCVGLYLPNCLLTEKVVGDQDGILTEAMSFSANRGEEGTSEEIFMGFC
jgi:hypothetical protein